MAAARPRRKTARSPAEVSRWPELLGFRAKFTLTLGPSTRFGDGKAALLERVDSMGSLRKAAQSMGMSYRHAWGLLNEVDRAAGFRMLEHSGPGTRTRLRLSAEGSRFLKAYRAFQGPLAEQAKRHFKRVFQSGN